jgi:hypothetical protein
MVALQLAALPLITITGRNNQLALRKVIFCYSTSTSLSSTSPLSPGVAYLLALTAFSWHGYRYITHEYVLCLYFIILLLFVSLASSFCQTCVYTSRFFMTILWRPELIYRKINPWTALLIEPNNYGMYLLELRIFKFF